MGRNLRKVLKSVSFFFAGIADCLRKVYVEEGGFRGCAIYRGLGAACMVASLTIIIYSLLYYSSNCFRFMEILVFDE